MRSGCLWPWDGQVCGRSITKEGRSKPSTGLECSGYGSVFAGHVSRLQNVLGGMRAWEAEVQSHHGTLWSGFLTLPGDSWDP